VIESLLPDSVMLASGELLATYVHEIEKLEFDDLFHLAERMAETFPPTNNSNGMNQTSTRYPEMVILLLNIRLGQLESLVSDANQTVPKATTISEVLGVDYVHFENTGLTYLVQK